MTIDATRRGAVVRRVKDLAAQAELFPVWRYHAVFTDNPHELVTAEAEHRDHAIVEQVFADLFDGPLSHLPSGRFAANAAWLTLAALVHKLLRAVGALASAFHAATAEATSPCVVARRALPRRDAHCDARLTASGRINDAALNSNLDDVPVWHDHLPVRVLVVLLVLGGATAAINAPIARSEPPRRAAPEAPGRGGSAARRRSTCSHARRHRRDLRFPGSGRSPPVAVRPRTGRWPSP